jgi:hypothetical protein
MPARAPQVARSTLEVALLGRPIMWADTAKLGRNETPKPKWQGAAAQRPSAPLLVSRIVPHRELKAGEAVERAIKLGAGLHPKSYLSRPFG